MKSRLKGFADLADLPEDDRIGIIGRMVMDKGITAAVVVDADPGKAERYEEKLTSRFPGVRVIERVPGPVANTITLKVGPKHEGQ